MKTYAQAKTVLAKQAWRAGGGNSALALTCWLPLDDGFKQLRFLIVSPRIVQQIVGRRQGSWLFCGAFARGRRALRRRVCMAILKRCGSFADARAFSRWHFIVCKSFKER